MHCACLHYGNPKMLLAVQVALYKYIVNVEGNCAALRLKHLLAGPSAVFFVQTDEIEWFYPLLKPFVHYIPVSFSWAGETHCLAGFFPADFLQVLACMRYAV